MQFMSLVRELVAERGLDDPEIESRAVRADVPEELELSDFGAVVFAGGFRPDYTSWLPWPEAFDELGFPIHVRRREHRRARALLRRRPLPAQAEVVAPARRRRGRRARRRRGRPAQASASRTARSSVSARPDSTAASNAGPATSASARS